MSKKIIIILIALVSIQFLLGCQRETIPDGVRADEYRYFVDWYKTVDQIEKENKPITQDVYKKLRDDHPDVVERNLNNQSQPKESDLEIKLALMCSLYNAIFEVRAGTLHTKKDPVKLYKAQKELVKKELNIQ